MGQLVGVRERPTPVEGVIRYELNRNLSGQGHQRFAALTDVSGTTPSAELARRLFNSGKVGGVHIYANMVTVNLADGKTADGLDSVVEELYRYWVDGVEPPTFDDSDVEDAGQADTAKTSGLPAHLLERSKKARARAGGASAEPSAANAWDAAKERIPAHLLERSRDARIRITGVDPAADTASGAAGVGGVNPWDAAKAVVPEHLLERSRQARIRLTGVDPVEAAGGSGAAGVGGVNPWDVAKAVVPEHLLERSRQARIRLTGVDPVAAAGASAAVAATPTTEDSSDRIPEALFDRSKPARLVTGIDGGPATEPRPVVIPSQFFDRTTPAGTVTWGGSAPEPLPRIADSSFERSAPTSGVTPVQGQ